MAIISIIAFLVVFSLLVLVHEFGHYFAARFFGVRVEEFGIGIPPRITSKRFKKNGTIWSVNWVPIGGFVRMKGQDDFSLAQSKSKDSFSSKSKIARGTILIAGVFMNYALAIFLLTIGFLIGMQPIPGSDLYNHQLDKNQAQIIISDLRTDSAAAQAGFHINDVIVSIDQIPVNSIDFLQETLRTSDHQLNYLIHRDDKDLNIEVTPDPETHQTGMVVDALVDIEPVSLSLGTAFVTSFHEANRIAVATIYGIGDLVMNIVSRFTVPDGVAGPVGIVNLIGAAANHGFIAILQLTAILSISLAVINIIPFPALDGGRLLFILFEALTFSKKRVPEKIEGIIHLTGFALVIALLLVITWNDILNMFG